MTYALVAYFLATGHVYVERRNLSLGQCEVTAAIVRSHFAAARPKLSPLIGDARFFCVPEQDL